MEHTKKSKPDVEVKTKMEGTFYGKNIEDKNLNTQSLHKYSQRDAFKVSVKSEGLLT